MAASSQFSIAVHVLAILAKTPGEYVKSDFLAGSVNTNPVVIRRLLCSLNDAGLVVSQVGACGGTTLAKNPGEITLWDVSKAVTTNEVFGLPVKEGNQKCDIGKNIGGFLQKLQVEIEDAVEARLNKVTLCQVLTAIGCKES